MYVYIYIYKTTKHTERQKRKIKKITCAFRMEVSGLSLLQNNF